MIRIHSHARVFLNGSENHGTFCSRVSARQMISASPGLREKRPFIRKITAAVQTAKQLLFCGEKHGQAPPPVPVTGRRLLLRRGYPCPGNRTLFHVRKTLAADPQSGKNRVQKPFCGQSLREEYYLHACKDKGNAEGEQV